VGCGAGAPNTNRCLSHGGLTTPPADPAVVALAKGDVAADPKLVLPEFQSVIQANM
jgi:hypothetical protein